MKKILSVLCILLLCLSAGAQKKTTSSSKAATSSSQSSGGSRSSSRTPALGHHKGQIGINADLGYYYEQMNRTTTGGGQTNTVIIKDPRGVGIDFFIGAGATYFLSKNWAVGGSLGFNSNTTFQGTDANGDDLHQVISLFAITPAVSYYVPIANWLQYAPQFYFGVGFGSNKVEQQINPYTVQTGSANMIQVGLDFVRFEILASKKLSLIVNLGGMYADFRTTKTGGNAGTVTTTNTTINLAPFGNMSVGVRYYVK